MGNRHFSNNDYDYEYFIFKQPLDYENDYLVDFYSNIKQVKDSLIKTSLIKRRITDKPIIQAKKLIKKTRRFRGVTQ